MGTGDFSIVMPSLDGSTPETSFLDADSADKRLKREFLALLNSKYFY